MVSTDDNNNGQSFHNAGRVLQATV